MLTWRSFEGVSCASHGIVLGHAIIPLEKAAIMHALLMSLCDTDELRTTPRHLAIDAWSASFGELSDKFVPSLQNALDQRDIRSVVGHADCDRKKR